MWTTENQAKIRAALASAEAATRGLRFVAIGSAMDMGTEYGSEVIAGSGRELRAAMGQLDSLEFTEADDAGE